jgi:hypothetical protein
MKTVKRGNIWRVLLACEFKFNNQTFFKEELLEILPGTVVSTRKAY